MAKLVLGFANLGIYSLEHIRILYKNTDSIYKSNTCIFVKKVAKTTYRQKWLFHAIYQSFFYTRKDLNQPTHWQEGHKCCMDIPLNW